MEYIKTHESSIREVLQTAYRFLMSLRPDLSASADPGFKTYIEELFTAITKTQVGTIKVSREFMTKYVNNPYWVDVQDTPYKCDTNFRETLVERIQNMNLDDYLLPA